MSARPSTAPTHELDELVYPSSDGNRMAENTQQFEWIVIIKENLDAVVPHFVAGDLLWYPVKGRPDIRYAPDVMVAIGRPKGHRSSYLQWREDGVAPQVVFEILSPGNTLYEMTEKGIAYQQYGVEEYYLYDPDSASLRGFVRRDHSLLPIAAMNGWTSPLLGIRFELGDAGLVVYGPDGERFERLNELRSQRNAERARAHAERARADTERERADTERERADTERERADTERERADALTRELAELRAKLAAAG